ncbi:MAG: DNA-processing protein DprA [Candidatus Gracilibacteria bacterium]|nr:DNA-processing protein DprA [Candidatus Gracilibacteria bacterium]
MNPSLLSLVFLHSLGFSQRALCRIFETRDNYEEIYESLDLATLQKLGFQSEKVNSLLSAKTKIDTVKIRDVLEKLEVRIVTKKDPDYPELLLQAPVHPYFLYVRGTLPSHANLISVVGSRKSTAYSRAVLEEIIPGLVDNGYGIVSGGAHGVDSLGHKISLEHGGYTVAVFGTGIDRCYPKENKELFINILKGGGALISALPIGMGPEPYNFPIRNEIVAGISRGTLVTEAAIKSGTLITAGLALDFGRDVFATPGDITKTTSNGTNALIRDGQAKLTTSAGDILGEYETTGFVQKEAPTVIPVLFDDAGEKNIYELLRVEPLDISSIEDHLGEDITTIAFKLSMMEVRGIIEMGLDGRYGVK